MFEGFQAEYYSKLSYAGCFVAANLASQRRYRRKADSEKPTVQ